MKEEILFEVECASNLFIRFAFIFHKISFISLLSRVVTHMEGYKPTICPVYPKEGCKYIIPLFEDREVYKSIEAQIRSAGGIVSYDEENADILLYCDLPLENTHNVDRPEGKGYDDRDLPAFLEKMKKAMEDGKAVALADIAYCNFAIRTESKKNGRKQRKAVQSS